MARRNWSGHFCVNSVCEFESVRVYLDSNEKNVRLLCFFASTTYTECINSFKIVPYGVFYC